MTAQEIVKAVISKGFLLWLESDKLMVKPKADDETRASLHQHKAEVVSFLRGQKTPNQEPAKNSGLKSEGLPTSEIINREPLRRERDTTEGKTLPGSPIVSPASPNEKLSDELFKLTRRVLDEAKTLPVNSSRSLELAKTLDTAIGLELDGNIGAAINILKVTINRKE